MDLPRMKMLTSIPLTIMFLGAVVCNALPERNTTRIVAKCPPGSYDASERGSQPYCLPCQEGHYNDEYNNYRSCKKHRMCKSSEEVLNPGTATSNVVCQCKKGARHYYNLDDVYGYDCLECKLGNVSRTVARNALDAGDTACCPNTTIAVRTQSGELYCQDQQDKHCIAPTTLTPAIIKDDLTQSPDRFWLTPGFVGAFIGLILGLLSSAIGYYCLNRRRRRLKLSSKTSPPIYRAKYSHASNNVP